MRVNNKLTKLTQLDRDIATISSLGKDLLTLAAFLIGLGSGLLTAAYASIGGC